MAFDDEGFSYPIVDLEMCVDCGRCSLACPLVDNHSVIRVEPVLRALAVTNRDDKVRAASTSSGAFDALVRHTLDRGGLVVGAHFDKNFRVVHSFASDAEGSASFYGSKYVQSDLVENDVYRKVLEVCRSGRRVLFSGTPCQVQGIHTFLGCDYPNLVTCDFVCHAVPSPQEWEGYLENICSEYGSRPVSVVFRHKTFGYHSDTMRIVFENGKTYQGSGRIDPWQKAYFANVISRPSCYECRFRHLERSSDFTIFDCWSYTELTGQYDDNLGHSHLWLHTEKALSMLEELKEWLDWQDVRLEEVLSGDGIMAVKNIALSPNREEFLAFSRANGLQAAVRRYMPVTRVDRVIEKSKTILYRIGILPILSQLKRKHRRGKERDFRNEGDR